MNVPKLQRLCGVLLALSMCLTILPVPGMAQSSSAIKEELNALKDKNAEIKAEIDGIRQQYNATANQIQDLVNRKDAVDQEIGLLHEQIQVINQQITAYGQLIADSQDDLDDAQLRLDALNEKHKERIRAMEEAGTISYWQVLFEANSFTDFLDRLEMINEISASDQKRINEIQKVAQEVSVTRDQMQEELS